VIASNQHGQHGKPFPFGAQQIDRKMAERSLTKASVEKTWSTDNTIFVVTFPIHIPTAANLQLKSNGVVIIKFDSYEIALRDKRESQEIVFWSLAMIITMFIVLFAFIHFKLIRPIEILKRSVDSKNGPPPVLQSDYHFPGELGSLAETLKKTFQKLEEREKALVASGKKAEIANTAKSNFLATMSHEIRTPLNGVLGVAQLLMATDLDGDQRQKLNIILSSGQTLLAIINDVLDMSKIEAGGIELEEKSFTVNEFISSIASPFQNLADGKNLTLNVKNTLASDTILKGDPARLRQIIWNLLSNAIKFTERGNVSLLIEAIDQKAFPALARKDCLVQFTVKDTGAGIAADRLGAVFESFTQEDNSISRRHGGTGLGLTIVKQLTELMSGEINVTSTLDVGTSFVVHIPFKKGSKEESIPNSLPDATLNKQENKPLNILVAEDNDVNAMIALAFIKKFGHTAKHVENGALAVAAVKEGWANLILMDVHMPEMNGIEATKAIRATPYGKTLPILGLTAEAFADRHAELISIGMNAVITKPFTEKQLADAIQNYRQAAPPLTIHSVAGKSD
ncbi:MAG: ATP-binding protein, partial [Sneathiella sp.]